MKKLHLLLIFSLIVCFAYAIDALHVSPIEYQPGSDVELLVEVTQGLEEISEVYIQYRVIGEERWIPEPMKAESPGSVYWRGIIPKTALADTDVEYYFEYKMISGNVQLIPPDDGVSPRYTIRPRAPQGTKTDGFVLVSDDASITTDDGYILVVSFFGLEEEIDPSSLKVWVNGIDVTQKTVVSGPTIVYREDKPKPGIQKAMVVANAKGKEIYSDTWATEILPGSKRGALPFSVRGSVNLASNVYDVSDKNAAFGATENDIATWLDLYGNYGVLDVQTNLYVSSLEESNNQPINRYTFGAKIPSFEMYFGDYSPMITPYVAANKNIRGLYSKIQSKNLLIQWAQGEAVRKTTFEGDSSSGIESSGTFKREVMAGRFQMGNENGFSIALNASRHRDIRSSLDKTYWWKEDNPDTLEDESGYKVRAQDNAVVSLDMKMNIPDQNIVMGLEVAGSLLNTNTLPGPFSTEDLEDYDVELEIDPADFAELFVINKNMEPFMPSRANLAWNAFFRTFFWNNMFSAQYSETGSAFNTLGAYTQLKDSKMIQITDQFSIGRYLYFSGGFSLIQDNLMEHKSETNSYTNIFGQAILRIPRMPYLKTSYYSNVAKNKDNSEIVSNAYPFVPFTRESSNMSFGIGYNFIQIPKVPSQLDISYRTGNDSSKLSSILDTDNESNGLNFTINSRFSMIPLQTQIGYSSTNNTATIPTDKEMKSSNFLLRADYSLWQNKIKPYLSFRTTGLSGDQDTQAYNYYTLGLESYPLKNLTVSTDLGMKSYTNNNNSSMDYDTTTWRLLITQRF